jgi:hypothetical protein
MAETKKARTWPDTSLYLVVQLHLRSGESLRERYADAELPCSGCLVGVGRVSRGILFEKGNAYEDSKSEWERASRRRISLR